MTGFFSGIGTGGAGAAVAAAARAAQAAAQKAAVSPPVLSQPAYNPINANSTGQYARPMEAPSTPTLSNSPQDIDAYLGGDSGYQGALSQLAQVLADFQADATRRKGSLDTEFGLSSKALGDQRLKDLSTLEDDYGARGLARSGLYGKAVGDYEQEYGSRVSDLQRSNTDALAALTAEQSQFEAQQKLKEQAAKEQAIARRASTYGV